MRIQLRDVTSKKMVHEDLWRGLAVERGNQLARLRRALADPDARTSEQIVDLAIKRLGALEPPEGAIPLDQARMIADRLMPPP